MEWERRNRPMGPYLEHRGFYADHLYIYVEEEYGYASFIWVYPGTAEELVTDWVEGRVPWRGPRHRYPYRGEFDAARFETPESERGLPWDQRTLQLVHWETKQVFPGYHRRQHLDGHAHVHDEDDSYLKVDYYEVRGIRSPKVELLVLDALAAIR